MDFLEDVDEVYSLLIGLNELVVNAMEHGNQMIFEKKVLIQIKVLEKYIQFVVTDEGGGFDWRERVDQVLDLKGHSKRGRGIAITQMTGDGLFYNEKGNQVTCMIQRGKYK